MRARIRRLLTAALLGSGLLFLVPSPVLAEQRNLGTFLDSVANDLDAYWTETARQRGFPYRRPNVRVVGPREVLVNQCGRQTPPFHTYCLLDHTIYLEGGFQYGTSFGVLWRGDMDFAIVQIFAHEWGHAIQGLLGILTRAWPQVNIELQADCLSGLFTRWANDRGMLDPGDYEEAISILSSATSPNHGTGGQRVSAFRHGFSSRDSRTCTI